MLTQIVDIIKNISLRHKGVKTFKYQNKIYNNAQNNHLCYQVYLSTVSHHQLNITTNIFKQEYTLYILGQPDNDKKVVDIQDDCYTIAVNILGYLDNHPDYKGVLSVYDYDILTLSEYTDDNSSGVRLSIVLETPSPLNLCELYDNFNDEPYQGGVDKEITLPEKNDGHITLNPIRLPINKC